jgi:hypothetical protein
MSSDESSTIDRLAALEQTSATIDRLVALEQTLHAAALNMPMTRAVAPAAAAGPRQRRLPPATPLAPHGIRKPPPGNGSRSKPPTEPITASLGQLHPYRAKPAAKPLSRPASAAGLLSRPAHAHAPAAAPASTPAPADVEAATTASAVAFFSAGLGEPPAHSCAPALAAAAPAPAPALAAGPAAASSRRRGAAGSSSRARGGGGGGGGGGSDRGGRGGGGCSSSTPALVHDAPAMAPAGGSAPSLTIAAYAAGEGPNPETPTEEAAPEDANASGWASLNTRKAANAQMLVAASEAQLAEGSHERMMETVRVAAARAKLSDELCTRLREAVLGMCDDGSMDWRSEWDEVLSRHRMLNLRREEHIMEQRTGGTSAHGHGHASGHAAAGAHAAAAGPHGSGGEHGGGGEHGAAAVRQAAIDLTSLGRGDGGGEAEDGATIDQGFVNSIRGMVDELVLQAHSAKRELREKRKAAEMPLWGHRSSLASLDHAPDGPEGGGGGHGGGHGGGTGGHEPSRGFKHPDTKAPRQQPQQQQQAAVQGPPGRALAKARPTSAASSAGSRAALSRSGSAPQWLPRGTSGGILKPEWMPRHAMPTYQPDAPPAPHTYAHVFAMPSPTMGASASHLGSATQSAPHRERPGTRGTSAASSTAAVLAARGGFADDDEDSPQRPRRHLGKQLSSTSSHGRPASAQAPGSAAAGGAAAMASRGSMPSSGLDALEEKLAKTRAGAYKRQQAL